MNEKTEIDSDDRHEAILEKIGNGIIIIGGIAIGLSPFLALL
jgi:hypothetical protein